MIKLTLLVCTYNNAEILKAALHSFTLQSGIRNNWEVIVVANNCSDHTSTVCEEFQATGQLPELRILFEPRQGLAYARKTGLRASRGEWVAFIDDDCRLASDWVARAIEFVDSHPQAGVVGGRNLLDWEIEPSDLHTAYGESFAGQDWGLNSRRAFSHNRDVPCGAGMLIRHSALLQSGYLTSGRLTGRDPIHTGAGEDTETALFVAKQGWEVWYCPDLNLQHFIPRQRMTLPYMYRIHYGFGCAEAYLRCLASDEGFCFSGRVRQLRAALKELAVLLRRFPLGFVWYRNERPTWCIRWYYTFGFLRGAVVNLFCGGRSNRDNAQGRTAFAVLDQERCVIPGQASPQFPDTTSDPHSTPALKKKAA